MAVNNASLIVIEGIQLLDATTLASLAIAPRSAGATQVPRILEVRAMATNTVVMVMVMVIGRSVVVPMPLIPISSRSI